MCNEQICFIESTDFKKNCQYLRVQLHILIMYCLSMISPVYQWILDWNAYPPPPSPFRNMKVQQEDYCILPISALLEIMKIKVRFYFGRKSTRASLDELLVFSSKDNSFNMKRKYSFTCIYIVHLKKKINCNKRLGIHVISIYILRSSLVYGLILSSHSVLIKKVNKSDNFVQ